MQKHDPQRVKRIKITTATINESVVQTKHCESCGEENSEGEHELYDGLCWECWDGQMPEECESYEGVI